MIMMVYSQKPLPPKHISRQCTVKINWEIFSNFWPPQKTSISGFFLESYHLVLAIDLQNYRFSVVKTKFAINFYGWILFYSTNWVSKLMIRKHFVSLVSFDTKNIESQQILKWKYWITKIMHFSFSSYPQYPCPFSRP